MLFSALLSAFAHELGLFDSIFPTTLYRGADIRTHVTPVSRLAPDPGTTKRGVRVNLN